MWLARGDPGHATLGDWGPASVAFAAATVGESGGRARVWASIDNGLDIDKEFDRKPLSVGHLEWHGDYSVDGLLDDVATATQGAIDRIFVAYGFSHCFYFDDEGPPVEELSGRL